MKNSFTLLIAMIFSSIVWGQTTLISPTGVGGFETGSTFTSNGWTTVNDATNTWNVGTVSTPSLGTNAAFISNDNGVSYLYTNSTTQVSYFYRDITVPAGESNITLSFKWKNNGESGSYDRIFVYTAPTTSTPVANSTTVAGSTDITGTTTYLVLQTTYQTATYSLPSNLAGTTFRLIFGWKNDGSGGNQPPASVDEISLTSAAPVTYYWVGATGTNWNTPANWNTAADNTGTPRTVVSPTDVLIVDGAGTIAGAATTINVDLASFSIGQFKVTSNTVCTLQSSAVTTRTITITGGPANDFVIENGSTLNLTNATNAVAFAFSGSGNTGDISGIYNASSSTSNVITTSGGTGTVVTVASTGVVNNSILGSSGCLAGSVATLVFSNGSNYTHSAFTSSNGLFPLATWGATSNITITGGTTSTGMTNAAQTFGNITYNSATSTGTMSAFTSGTTVIQGNLNIINTNTGKFRALTSGTLTINGNLNVSASIFEVASTTGTLNVLGNVNVSGGTFDIAQGGASYIKVAGSFTQTAGIVQQTFATGTLEFNGIANQAVTFATQPTGPVTYRISNPLGITLSAPFANFAIGNGTSGGLRISTTFATPITFAGSLTDLQYNAANSTLTYDAPGNITANTLIFPVTSGPTSLTTNLGAGNILTIPFDRTLSGTLTMTSGDINMGAYTLTLGTSTSVLGTLSGTSGSIIGNFKRWYTNATASKDFPVGIIGAQRKATINFTAPPTIGGTLTARFIPTDPGNIGLPLTEGAITVNTAAKAGYWKIDAGDGLSGGTYTASYTATNFPGVNAFAGLVLIKRPSGGGSWTLEGTHVATTGTNLIPVLSRTGITTFSEFGVGGDAANNPMSGTNIFSIATGNWGDGSTWSTGTVPNSGDYVTISAGHTVTTAGGTPPYACYNLTISASGNLTVSGNDLTIGGILTNNGTFNSTGGTTTITGGSATGITNAATTGFFIVNGGTVTLGTIGGGKTTFTNNGTLTVSATGILNINGNLNIASGSTFNQSGGNINIDGNAAGNTTNSVSSSTALLLISSNLGTVNGGTLTIVDPPAAASSSRCFQYSVSTLNSSWIGHTLRFGDGSNIDASANTNGFEFDCYVSTGKLLLGNVIINGGNTTNRWVTSSSSSGNGSFVGGDFTVNSGSEFANISGGAYILIGGNIVNNGIMTILTSINLGSISAGIVGATTSAQSISGSGIFRNLATSPTANLTAFSINNSNPSGVTIGIPLSMSGALTLTTGILNTTSTNLLTLSSASIVNGGSTTAYINGPLARTFVASRTATGTYGTSTIYPVGKGASYLPIYIDPTTNSGGSVIFSGEAFTSNSGSFVSPVISLSTNRWEAIITSGGANFTSSFIRFGDASIISTNQILQAINASGVYGVISPTSTFTAGTPNTLTTTASQIPAASYNGYFAYGNLIPCTAPSDQPTSLVTSNMTTTSFTGTFTLATSLPSHYLVVRYASGASPTNPVNNTNYIVGGALGTGIIAAIISTNTFNQSGLIAGTTYDYYIYSFNNSGCYGPVYNTVAPLLTPITTCFTSIGVPGTPTVASLLPVSFTANWTASVTPGVSYTIDVATDIAFTTFVSGYQNKNVNNALTDNIIGLSEATTYYVRVKAVSPPCNSVYSGTLTVITPCSPVSLFPFTDNFGATLGCWSYAEGSGGASQHWTTTTADATHGVAAPQSGTHFAMLNVYNASKTYNPYYLISNSFNLDATPKQVKYFYWLGNEGYKGTGGADSIPLRLQISTDGGIIWTNIYQHTSANSVFTPTSSVAGWTENIVNLPTYVSQTVKFRFASNSNFGNGYCNQGIDEFVIQNIVPPIITSLSATSGCVGTSLTINGTGLNAATLVTIGGTAAVITANTATAITVTVGTGTTGVVGVTTTSGSTTSSETFTVKQLPSIFNVSGGGTYCAGGTGVSIALSGSEIGVNYSLSTSPITTLPGDGNPLTFGPTAFAGGVYTITATNTTSSCSSAMTGNATVIVNPIPSAVTVTPATVGVCVGNIQTLVASGGAVSGISILSENFNGGTNSWTTVNNSTGGTPANAAWTLRPDGYEYSYYGIWHSNDDSQFYLSNSDAQGSSSTTATILQSPSFSTIGFSEASLSFYHYFRYGYSGTAKVEASTDGTNWTTLQTYTADEGAIDDFANSTISLTAPFLNQASVYIRFKYDAAWQYFWGIDNVSISGAQTAAITWTPINDLYNEAGATTAYIAGTDTTTVYTKPTANRTYTATATSGAGCTNSGTSVVTLNPIPTANITVSNNLVCAGDSIAISITFTGTGPWLVHGLTKVKISGGVPSVLPDTLVSVNPFILSDFPNKSAYYYLESFTDNNGCSNDTANWITVTVDPISVAGAVTGGTTICSGSTSGLLSLDTHIGTIVRWESSVSPFTTWIPIANTLDTYTSGALTATTHFRAVVKSGVCNEAFSTETTVTVDPSSDGGTLTGGTALCSTVNSTLLTLNLFTGIILRWESSLNGSTWTPIANTVNTYTANNIAVTTYFRVVVQSGVCNIAYSDTATFTVNTPPVPTITAHTDPSVCGESTGTATVSAATSYIWSTTPAQYGQQATGLSAGTYFVTVSNGVCTGITSVTLTDPSAPVVNLVSNDTTMCAGTLVTFTASGADTYEFFIDGISQGPPSTTAIFTSSTLANGNVVNAKGITAGCTGNSGEITMIVSPVSNGGSLVGANTVCLSSNSTTLTLNSYYGNIIRWESSTDGIIWTPFANTLNTYVANNLTVTTHYRVVVKSGVCDEANSSVAIITVSPVSVGGAVTGGTAICSGSTSGLLTLGTHTGTIVRWESSVSPFTTWTPIVNTLDTYTSGILTATTQFRAVVQSGVCSSDNSTATIVTVSPTSFGGTVIGSDTVCYGANSTILTVGGYTGLVVKWQSSLNGTIWNDITNTTNTFTATNLTATTYYRAVVQSGVCSSDNSSIAIVTTLPQGNQVVTASETDFCLSGSTLLTATPTTGYGSAIFQWQNSTDNILFTNIPSANSTTYNTPVLNTTTYYKLLVKAGTTVCSESNVATVTVNNPQILTTAPGTRCGIGTVVLGATASAGTTLNWYEDSIGGPILGTGISFTTPPISTTTTYYVGANLVGGSTNATIGTDISLTSSTGYPTAFGNRWYQDWSQMVYTAAELNAAGLAAGNITAITFNIGAIGSSASVSNYTISLGTTSNSTLTGFTTTGLTTCYGPATYTSNVGANIITFSTPFVWDGVSNVIVDIRGTGINATNNATTTYTATTGNNTVVYAYSSSNNTSYYTSNPTASTSVNRLNAVFAGIGVCSGARSSVVATVTTAPTVTATATPTTICAGDPTTLEASSTNAGYTYTWSPATIPASGASVQASPLTTGIYTVTAVDNSGGANNGCVAIANVNVTVNPLPTTVIITPASTTVCAGSIQSLVASGGTMAGISILSENFNGATNSWTTINNSTGGTPADAAWTLRPDGYVYSTYGTWHSNDSSQFYLSNSDDQSSGSTTATILQSPSFSTIGFTSANISFYHYYRNSGDAAKVEASTNGTNWTTLQTYTTTQGAIGNFANATVALTAPFLNQDTVYVRFKYDAAWDYYWGIDNVSISGAQTAAITWLPTTDLFTDAAATIPYTGTDNTTVYSKPTANRTYTATATSLSMCTSSTNVVVTYAPLPVVDLGDDTTLCIDQSILLNAGNFGASYLWTPGGQITQTKTVDGSLGLGAHTISVLVTDANSCSATGTIVVTFNSCAGIVENNDDISISVIPNPSNGLFYLTVKGLNEIATLNIFSMSGQIIYTEQLDNTGFVNKPIDLKLYPKGMYFLRLVTDNYSYIEKIIIE